MRSLSATAKQGASDPSVFYPRVCVVCWDLGQVRSPVLWSFGCPVVASSLFPRSGTFFAPHDKSSRNGRLLHGGGLGGGRASGSRRARAAAPRAGSRHAARRFSGGTGVLLEGKPERTRDIHVTSTYKATNAASGSVCASVGRDPPPPRAPPLCFVRDHRHLRCGADGGLHPSIAAPLRGSSYHPLAPRNREAPWKRQNATLLPPSCCCCWCAAAASASRALASRHVPARLAACDTVSA